MVGLQQADAVATLQGINMQTNIVEIQAEDKPEGTVLAQNPPPGESVPEQTVVTLQVVGPSEQVEIPDVTGQDQLTAAATLGRNFQVETQQEESDTVAVGRGHPHRSARRHEGGTRQRRHDGHLGGHPGDDGPGPRGAHASPQPSIA